LIKSNVLLWRLYNVSPYFILSFVKNNFAAQKKISFFCISLMIWINIWLSLLYKITMIKHEKFLKLNMVTNSSVGSRRYIYSNNYIQVALWIILKFASLRQIRPEKNDDFVIKQWFANIQSTSVNNRSKLFITYHLLLYHIHLLTNYILFTF
jgi:hypothetical protein